MGEVLFDLEQVLRSKQERLTPAEAKVLLTYKSKAVREFTAGALVGSGVTWLGMYNRSCFERPASVILYISSPIQRHLLTSSLSATWRLNKLLRVNLSGGKRSFIQTNQNYFKSPMLEYIFPCLFAMLQKSFLPAGAAIVCGFWRFTSSLESCVDSILGVDGSRLQKELANIIFNKYRDDPWRMQLISKHFYSEKVYDDSTSDQPKLRWRYKNYFNDNVAYGQRTQESDSYGDSHTDSHNNSHNEAHSDFQNDSGSKKNDLESNKVLVKPDVDAVMDPLDCVFGNAATMEEIHHPNKSSTPTRVLSRNHKRSHRRRRMRHHEGSLEPHYA
ncbi:hypothetical protein Pint_24797 [Pistacia integerrima]|uniref:Uncharacterized protein n=1 Tax=Pistacia integerrima TaxID=434235 RepID=A0ACC0YDS2_9ROSI|nr:hypothetical protein Pint_24797 [Pistacia integerrima]